MKKKIVISFLTLSSIVGLHFSVFADSGIQNDLKSYCDQLYKDCLENDCKSADPEQQKKCFDKCKEWFEDCKKGR